MKHRIEFRINHKKALEAVMYILEKDAHVKMYNLLKILYEADKSHLNKHGRPVTGDTYMKMSYGTVPSAIYDLFKGDELFLMAADEKKKPFAKEKQGSTIFIKGLRKADRDYLSKSDIKALDAGIKTYLKLSFGQVKDRNHKEKAWLEAEMNSPISFEAMIDNEDILEELETNPLRTAV